MYRLEKCIKLKTIIMMTNVACDMNLYKIIKKKTIRFCTDTLQRT